MYVLQSEFVTKCNSVNENDSQQKKVLPFLLITVLTVPLPLPLPLPLQTVTVLGVRVGGKYSVTRPLRRGLSKKSPYKILHFQCY